MIIERDVAGEAAFFERAREFYSRSRYGVHLSDLLGCLRKPYWQRIDPIPPDDEDVLFFILGEGHHEVLQRLFGARAEVKLRWQGIHFSVDVLENEEPIELKTTRQSSARHDEQGLKDVMPSWPEQVGGYMIAKGSLVGHLYAFHFVGKWNPPTPKLRKYKIRFNDDAERTAYENWLLARRDLLIESVKTHVIPPGPRWKKECTDWHCRYADRCVALGLLRREDTWLAEVPEKPREPVLDLSQIILPTCQCACGCNRPAIKKLCHQCSTENVHRTPEMPPREGWVHP